MAALIWLPLLLPALFAGVALVLRQSPWTRWLPVAAAAVLLLDGIALLLAVGGGPVVAGAGLLRTDLLSGWMLAVVGAVAVVSLWGGIAAGDDRPGVEHPRAEHPRGPRGADRPDATGGNLAAGSDRPVLRTGLATPLLCLFLSAMTLAVVADNVGLMWVAIELTTITTAFLVASGGGRNALEAAWKYVVLGAVGVAIAFLGIVLLSTAGRAAGDATLSWTLLLQHAGALDPTLVRVAGALAVLGFATKAGLAPMHSWLPDAHSQAPAPVSGLMSGVLLSVAFYVILRIQAVTDAAVGPGLMRTLLLVGGLLSLAVSAGLVITQRDYKRLLAYSSIEHMGLLALGAAAGVPLALAAVLLHMLGHGLVKAAMFLLAGRISALTGSHRIADVRHLLARRPDLAGPFLLGAAALLGFPPFVTFFTEVGIVVGGFQAGLTWQFAVACALLLIVFAGIVRHVFAMTLGAGSATAHDPEHAPRAGHAAMDGVVIPAATAATVPASVGTGPTGPSTASSSPVPRTGAARPAAAPTQPAAGDPDRRPRLLPVVLALGLAGVLGFAAWPLAGTLLDAVAALGGSR
jgi:hydrogenase-4 component F